MRIFVLHPIIIINIDIFFVVWLLPQSLLTTIEELLAALEKLIRVYISR
jgi:hypothetical protein